MRAALRLVGECDNQLADVIDALWLDAVRREAGGLAAYSVLGLSESGKCDDRKSDASAAQLVQQPVAVIVRHPDVSHDHVERITFDGGQRVQGGGDAGDVGAALL